MASYDVVELLPRSSGVWCPYDHVAASMGDYDPGQLLLQDHRVGQEPVMNINHTMIARSSFEELTNIRLSLTGQRMELDQKISIFLEQNELSDRHTDTPEWDTYHELLQEYDRVNTLYRSAEHFINRNPRDPNFRNGE